MQNQNIDHGNKFDWGKTSADYARFRTSIRRSSMK